jgi:hypothetical protein
MVDSLAGSHSIYMTCTTHTSTAAAAAVLWLQGHEWQDG